MKKITAILIAITIACNLMQANNWCETLIDILSSAKDVNRTTAIKRDSGTHKITYATYDFKFESENLYRKVYNTIIRNSRQADYFSEKTQDGHVTLIRFTDQGETWSCKLSKTSSQSQFLVTINAEGTNKSDPAKTTQRQSTQSQKPRKETPTTGKTHTDPDKAKAIQEHDREMEQARRERERLLRQ